MGGGELLEDLGGFVEAIHVLDYLDMRVAEGALLSALKCFKASLAFFEQVTGVEEKDKVSIKPLVVNSYKEVLLRASQGSQSERHHAPS